MSLADLAALATAAGVLLVFLQLVLNRRQQRTSLEDELAREYRETAQVLPPQAFFDRPDPDRPMRHYAEDLEVFVRYLDLSNQQVFLRMQRRISKQTWLLWSDGIKDNLERDAFKQAWYYVRRHSTQSYDELASLYSDWDSDPGWWQSPWWLRPFGRVRRKGPRPTPWLPPES